MKVGRWSTTAANNNATPPDGWPEGQQPSTVNDCAREMMASIRTMLNDLSFIDLDHSPTQTTSTTFTIPGNVASFYDVGRRVKAFDGSTLYGTVISSSFTTNTGVTLRLDSGVLTSSLSSIGVSVLGNSNPGLPAQVYTRKDLFINGCLDFWQRGNSFTFSGSGAAALGYVTDRFFYSQNTGSTINASRSERSAAGSNVPTLAQVGQLLNSSICLSVSAVDASIATGEIAGLFHIVEGYEYRTVAQKPLTVSFWVNSNRTGTYCVSARNGGYDRSYVSEYTISAASTWERKTITIPEPPSAGTWHYSQTAGIVIGFALAAGSTFQATGNAWTAMNAIATSNQVNFLGSAGNTIRFAGFQLEEGNYATPLRGIDVPTEFNRCKRYYQIIDSVYWTGYRSAGGGAAHTFMFQEMRDVPTATFGGTSYTNASGITDGGGGGATGIRVTVTVTGAGEFVVNNTGVALDAELV